MKLDNQKFIKLYEAQYGALDSSQASGLSALLGFLEQDSGVSDLRWAAYMLSTVKHECADRWQPIEEYGKGQGQPYGTPVRVTGSDGKTYVNTYYGRGYVQLTWETNYRNMSHNLDLGDQVLIHPERALDPPTAYKIMSLGMRNGSFTGVRLGDCISGSRCDYLDSRRIVNGNDRAELIQGYAKTLETLLRESPGGEGTGTHQYHVVNVPHDVNAQKGRGSFPVVHGVATKPGIKGDDYPYKDSQPDFKGGDKWGFYARECTSFVAWRINQLGVNFTNGMIGRNGKHPDDNPPVFGNGEHWADHARTLGFRVDNTPSVGAIAHYGPNAFFAGPMGHVAYVAQVNGDGTIVLEEYNWATPYAYHNPPRVTHPSQVTSFIHII